MKMPANASLCGVWLCAVLMAASLQTGAAASLRAAPPAKSAAVPSAKSAAAPPAKGAPKPAKSADAPATAQVAQAADLAERLLKKQAAAKEAASKPAAQKRQKLDVGFSDFEKNLTEEVGTQLLRAANGTAWNDDMRDKFTKNVSEAMRESLKVILKPVKQSIGKTWMALPQDAQKNEYVETLKNSFLPVFARSMETVNSHLELSLKRVESYSHEKTLSATQLLEKSEFSVGDSLLTEHCYEVGKKKSLKTLKKPANASEVLADKKKFCIQSVIGALAHRLNDTQGLISMSMRFEAGAMSLAQKKHKAPRKKAEVADGEWHMPTFLH